MVGEVGLDESIETDRMSQLAATAVTMGPPVGRPLRDSLRVEGMPSLPSASLGGGRRSALLSLLVVGERAVEARHSTKLGVSDMLFLGLKRTQKC